MKARRRKLRSHVRRHRLVRRLRFGLTAAGALLLMLGLRVATVDARPGGSDLPIGEAAANGLQSATHSGGGSSADSATHSGGGSSADAEASSPRVRFRQRFYAGLGGGLTRLQPRSRTAGLGVGDDQSEGYHLYAGYDFSRRLGGEIYLADLGAASIDFLGTEVGEVDYQVYGASLIAYWQPAPLVPDSGGWQDGLWRREGLSLYARVGLGGLRNDSALDYRRDHAAHLAFGGGLEYGFSNGVAVRAELMAFDTDARYATLSVLKRFGRPADRIVPVVARMPDDAAPAPRPEPAPAPAVPAGTEYTYFAFDRADLQTGATAALDALAAELAGSDAMLEVAGHADAIGSEAYNLELSRRRAMAVQSYLVANGVAAERLRIEAFGESRPVADNASREGRARNRRVEISRR